MGYPGSFPQVNELMHNWGFPLREGVFAETKKKKRFVETKIKKLALKIQEERELKCRTAKDKRLHGAASSWNRDYDMPRLVL